MGAEARVDAPVSRSTFGNDTNGFFFFLST